MRNNANAFDSPEISFREILIAMAISAAYLLVSYALIGLQPEQFVLVILYNALYFASAGSRKFMLGFSVFVVYWVIFDYMKAFPNYSFSPVHIKSMYDAELRYFGISLNGTLITANEYFRLHPQWWMDVLSGIFYLCWIPVPLLFAAYLFFRDRTQFLLFSFTFLTVNLIGFCIYYLYPAAPPWYVQQYGFEFRPGTPGGIAGLEKFDHFFNVTIFQSIYSKSSNVFAAMPSLHSAYPLVVFYFGVKNKLGLINIVLGIVVVGIWFAAIYTSHHYIADVLVGIACAVTGIIVFRWSVTRTWAQRLFNEYRRVIE